jgi:hypothetical protein
LLIGYARVERVKRIDLGRDVQITHLCYFSGEGGMVAWDFGSIMEEPLETL